MLAALASLAALLLPARAPLAPALALAPAPPRAAAPRAQLDEKSPLEKLQKAFDLFQQGNSAGGFKQGVADALAGEYDRDKVTAEVKSLAQSAPLVMFTWEQSPACKKAIKYLEMAGVSPKIIRLDNPWEEGNPRRAALGGLTGRTSVPSIWIGGKYIGGCDDGPSEEAPGLVPMAFKGTLRPKLEEVGALPKRLQNAA